MPTFRPPTARSRSLRQASSTCAAEAAVARLLAATTRPRSWSATWFGKRPDSGTAGRIAYFSAEFGLAACLPLYSGGLGVLAGDHLKAASDLGLPLVGVGLLYQRGYFQQYLNSAGYQQEKYPTNDFHNLPVRPARDEHGKEIVLHLPLDDRTLFVKVWRVEVGRVSLILLD